MKSKIEKWDSGWYGIELGLKIDEIDLLIENLEQLKLDHDQHFHISSNYEQSENIGDIEIYVLPSEDDESDLKLSSLAIEPGSSA